MASEIALPSLGSVQRPPTSMRFGWKRKDARENRFRQVVHESVVKVDYFHAAISARLVSMILFP